MLKNYLKIAFRNILKYKGYSFINISGLAIGMVCCLLIMLYVTQELSYDRFHKNAPRIYRIATEMTTPGGKTLTAQTVFPLAPALKMDYPGINKIARIFYWDDNALIKCGNKKFFEKRFVFADSELFDIFTFPVIKGKKDNLLADRSSLVITKSTAEKYFGKENPIGKIIQYDDRYSFKVAAVIEDIPLNSHFHFDFAAPISIVNNDFLGFTPNPWKTFYGIYSYMMLPENISVGDLENRVKGFITKHGGKDNSLEFRLFFQSLKDIYLHSHIENEIEANNYISNIIVISLIGLFILLIACINFVNLSTARSAYRSREIGMRKTLGAVRSQLIMQYIGESILFSIFAMVFSLVLVEIILPTFSGLVGKKMIYSFSGNISALIIIVGITIIVGFIAGIYPALFLSGRKTIYILKGGKAFEKNKKGPLVLRKILITFQFFISVILIIGTLIVRDQLKFFQQADLGFKKDYTVVIPLQSDDIREKYKTLKQELKSHPGVSGAAACFKAPIADSGITTWVYPNGIKGEGRISAEFNLIDFDFIDLFGLEITAGRNFLKQSSTGKEKEFIINEAAVKRLGYASPGDAIGKKLAVGINNLEGTVVGVTKDFHIAPLYSSIAPHVMIHDPENFYSLAVQIKSHNIPGTISFLQETYLKFSQKYPFRYSFLDKYITRLYAAEEQTLKIAGTFAAIAIFIACMGLFGMASFSVEQRRKEIGVRKVLGASVHGIVLFMSKEFTRWVLFANIVAWPTAYFIMERWLQNFAYRTGIEVGTFILAAVIALSIAWLTVSYQTVRAAIANPVQALRYE